jgi:dephospho-CoA kinase
VKIIGLTGGIGMGKSTAAAAFRQCSVPVFDADATVHRLQARHGPALPAIEAAFPGTVTNGVLNRAALRAQVLADRGALRRLERILHPMVRRAQRHFLAAARARGKSLVVLDIPLLLETGGDRYVDHVVVVSAPPALQMSRVKARRHMSDSDIRAMIALQMPDAEKRARANTIIRTGLSRYHAVRTIRRLVRKQLFFEKKNQKTFTHDGTLRSSWPRQPTE